MAFPKPRSCSDDGALWPRATEEVAADYHPLPLAARDTCRGTYAREFTIVARPGYPAIIQGMPDPPVTLKGEETIMMDSSQDGSPLAVTISTALRQYGAIRIKWTLDVERAQPPPQKTNDPAVSRVVEAAALGGQRAASGVSQTMVEASSGIAHSPK